MGHTLHRIILAVGIRWDKGINDKYSMRLVSSIQSPQWGAWTGSLMMHQYLRILQGNRKLPNVEAQLDQLRPVTLKPSCSVRCRRQHLVSDVVSSVPALWYDYITYFITLCLRRASNSKILTLLFPSSFICSPADFLPASKNTRKK